MVDASLHENTHRNPSFLPDGLHFLYSVIGNSDRSGVYVGSLDGKTKRLLLHVLTSAVYAPPGYVLFVDGDTLLGQAFDADRLELKGQPFFVAEHVGRSTSFMSGVSASLTGASRTHGRSPRTVVWRGLTAAGTRSTRLARLKATTRISDCLLMRHVLRRRWSIQEPTWSTSGSRILRAAATLASLPVAASQPLRSGRLMAPGWSFEAIEPE